MRTCLGAAAELQAAKQLPAGWAEGCAWLHCEGYCLHKPDVALAVMRAARQAGARVSQAFVCESAVDQHTADIAAAAPHCPPAPGCSCSRAQPGLPSPRRLPGCLVICLDVCFLDAAEFAAMTPTSDVGPLGVQVSLDLASFEVVRVCWSTLQGILEEGLLHTVFANEEEAAAVLEQSRAAESQAGEQPRPPADGASSGGCRRVGCCDGAPEYGSAAGGAANPGQAQSGSRRQADGHSAAAAATDCNGCNGAAETDSGGSDSSSGCSRGGGDGGKAAAGSAPASVPPSPAEQELLADGTVAAAQRWLLRHCEVSVVSLGPKGCVARCADGSAAACVADR